MNIKHRGLTLAFAVATLFAVQPAAAAGDTIELNGFWAGSGNATINFDGTNWHDGNRVALNESGGSGGFNTYDLTTDPSKHHSFESWCVDIFHNFSFAVSSIDVKQNAAIALAGSTATAPTPLSSKAATDLGRLYTGQHSVIDGRGSTADNQAAFQLAVWEIVNERSAGPYNLASGDFKASGTGSSTATTWLAELNNNPSTSAYGVSIWTVQTNFGPTGYAQDVAVFAPVPEPETYAMMLAGLGLMGFVARRRMGRDAA